MAQHRQITKQTAKLIPADNKYPMGDRCTIKYVPTVRRIGKCTRYIGNDKWPIHSDTGPEKTRRNKEVDTRIHTTSQAPITCQKINGSATAGKMRHGAASAP